MKHRHPKFVINPFVSEAQRRACYAADDPAWDCAEWEKATPKGKKLPKRKKPIHNKRRSPLKYDPSRTASLRKALVNELRKRFARIRISLRKLIVEENALALKPVANTATSEDRILEVPDVRQPDHYSCGAAAAASVGSYFGVGPDTIEDWKNALGTDVEESTRPGAIIAYFRSLGLSVESQSNLGLGDLRRYIQGNQPIIVPVQDYGPRVPAGARFDYGHYLVVIGLIPGYVVCQDPSADNVVAGGDLKSLSTTGSIQAPGRIIIRADDFLKLWHDKDVDGNKYIRFGIAVGKAPRDDEGPPLDASGGVVPADLDRARAADFVTLPPADVGTNCGNCKFIDNGFCKHPKVRFAVNDRNCCALWDAKGTLRAWEETQNREKECPQDAEECAGEEEIESTTKVAAGAGGRAQGIFNTRWQFSSDPEKIKRFQDWLKAQFGKDLTSPDVEALWKKYAEQGFAKGAGRAFDDVRGVSRTAAAGDPAKEAFFAGGKEEFLRSAFGRPVAIEKIQLLAGRSFDEMENITTDMGTRLSRTLTDGLVQGKSPRDIARDLDDDLDLGSKRAETIARTEIIRAHAEGQLDALEQLGVEEVGAQVEWSTTGDGLVCPDCAALEGVVLSLDEARGLLPLHPNCRCAWIPSFEPMSDKEKSAQLRGAGIDPDEVLNAAMMFPEPGEGKAATDALLKKRAAKGKDIGVPPPEDDEDVIQTEGQTGQESLIAREKKARRDQDAPPRNA